MLAPNLLLDSIPRIYSVVAEPWPCSRRPPRPWRLLIRSGRGGWMNNPQLNNGGIAQDGTSSICGSHQNLERTWWPSGHDSSTLHEQVMTRRYRLLMVKFILQKSLHRHPTIHDHETKFKLCSRSETMPSNVEGCGILSDRVRNVVQLRAHYGDFRRDSNIST
jgi:hypothetical protein